MASYDYLENFLKQKMYGSNPLFDQLFGNAQRRVGMSTDRNVRNILQQNAQSGFRGVGANQINDAYRTESDALTQINDQVMTKQLEDQNFAISQLLGLEQMKMQDTGFWDVLGGILGSVGGGLGGAAGGSLGASLFGSAAGGASAGGAAVLGAGAALSDIRLKENLIPIDSKNGLTIYKFNYIGNPQKYTGVIAQEVEQLYPEAVGNINGLKYVDYSKIGIEMTRA